MPSTSEIEGEASPLLSTDEHESTNPFADAKSEMTNGRRIANAISNTTNFGKGYNPSRNKRPITIPGNQEEGLEEKEIAPPILDKAWEYFEHYTLPRCFANRRDSAPGRKYSRAEPGEDQEKTILYPVWGTPMEDMADFGIGVGMYFEMVRFFGIVAIIAGFMSTPSIMFFINDYSSNGREGIENSGSAICTDTTWVPCPNCTMNVFDTWPTKTDNPSRVMNFTSTVDDSPVFFIRKNNCELNSTFSIMNLATIFFFALATLVFIFLQMKLRAHLDEGEQTTSDYSILIKNPPHTAKDPESWKAFFESAFENVHVTVCTVAIDNEDLIAKLVERRKFVLQLQNMLPLHSPFYVEDLERTVLQCPEPDFFSSEEPMDLYYKILSVDADIERTADVTYPASSVFITFETEEMQRRVLKEMTHPKLSKSVVDSRYKFEGLVLEITEPDEPSSIRWKDLDELESTRTTQRVATFMITCVLIALGAVIIAHARNRSTTWSAILIVTFNSLTPMVVRYLTSFESHIDETSYTTSSYIKVTLLRWVNTAIVTAVISPFAYTIADGDYLIKSVRILFTAELAQRPILQLSDIAGNLKRHYFAPRAKDQRRMNLLFSTAPYSIGERYTDVTKLLFLTCFYATLFPSAWFFSAAILFVYYWVDKFCVLRVWKQGPKINGNISIYSVYFFLMCVITYAVMGTYYMAMFPFDNVCETDEVVPGDYVGVYELGTNGNAFTYVSTNSKAYKYCDQDLFRYKAAFPPFPSDQPDGSEWMSEIQLKFLPIYARSCIGIISAVGAIVAFRFFIKFALPLFSRTRYMSQGRANEEAFSDVHEIVGYIPHVTIPGHAFPFLMCDITHIDDELIGWQRDNVNGFNTLIDKSQKNRMAENPAFSQVMHWPPSDANSSPKVAQVPVPASAPELIDLAISTRKQKVKGRFSNLFSRS